MKKIREVMRLRFERGASVREVSQGCCLAVSTVTEYLNRAQAAGIGWPLAEGLCDEDLEKALFPGRVKKGEPPRPLPDFTQLRRDLSRKGVTLLLLWREYRQAHPDGYGYSRFAELYTSWEKMTDLRMLQRHKAGEKIFVDWASAHGCYVGLDHSYNTNGCDALKNVSKTCRDADKTLCDCLHKYPCTHRPSIREMPAKLSERTQ